MGLTIGPAGSRAEMKRLLSMHAVGLFVGATVMALSLSLVGRATNGLLAAAAPVPPLFASGLLLLWAGRVAFSRGLGWPSSHWQVPASWRESLPPSVTLGAYGFLLGVGFLTSVVLPPFWILLGGTLVSNSVWASVGAWWLYAGMRFATTADASFRRFDAGSSPEDLASLAPSGWRAIRTLAASTLLVTALWLATISGA